MLRSTSGASAPRDQTPVRLLDEELALARGWGTPGQIGSALRRAGAAREAAAGVPLRAAVELAAHCGATPLAMRAIDELRAAGGRPITAGAPPERR